MSRTYADPEFDPRIADWLEPDPQTAPGALLATVLAAVPSIPQRRVGRAPHPRFPMMPTLSRALTAAIVIAIGAGGALLIQRPTSPGIGGPPPSAVVEPSAGAVATPSIPPPPSPVPMNLSSTWQSERYGYSAAVDPSWTVTPATLTWTGADNSGPVVDQLVVTGTTTVITVGSQPLLPGQTFDDWLEIFQPRDLVDQLCYGGAATTWPSFAIGGDTWRWQQMCFAGVALIAKGGRAYAFTALNGGPNQVGGISRDAFEHWLATVVFTPDSIPTPPAPPPLDATFDSARNGYSLRYPAGWAATQAEGTPGRSVAPVAGDPGVDVLTGPDLRLSVTSMALDKVVSPAAWARTFCAASQTAWSAGCDAVPAAWEIVPLATGSAWLTVNGDGAGSYPPAASSPQSNSRLFLATAVVKGRAYEIRLEGPVDRSLFLEILASMRLDPAAAADATPSP